MKILFITPSFDRGGSEVVLATLLRHMDRAKRQPHVFCKGDGKLRRLIPDDVPVHAHNLIYGSWWRPRALRLRARARGIEPLQDVLWRLHDRVGADLWYVNTMAFPEVVPLARRLSIPYLVHFHEMPFQMYESVDGSAFVDMIQGASLLLGPSDAVIEPLRLMGGSPVAVQPEFVALPSDPPSPDKRSHARRLMGAAENDFLWLMSGLASYRKGTDLILQIGRHFRGARVHLVWLGDFVRDNAYRRYVQKALEKEAPNVSLVSDVNILSTGDITYYECLTAADGFLLTSREDPFPLVMIEAAALGKPIVSFDSGGVRDFMRAGMGAVVRSWNVPDLTRAMEGVMDGSVPLEPGASKARARDFDASVQIQHWEALMDTHFPTQARDAPPAGGPRPG